VARRCLGPRSARPKGGGAGAHEAALRIDPRFLPSLAALGAALLDEGKVDEAERRIDAAYRGGERARS